MGRGSVYSQLSSKLFRPNPKSNETGSTTCRAQHNIYPRVAKKTIFYFVLEKQRRSLYIKHPFDRSKCSSRVLKRTLFFKTETLPKIYFYSPGVSGEKQNRWEAGVTILRGSKVKSNHMIHAIYFGSPHQGTLHFTSASPFSSSC